MAEAVIVVNDESFEGAVESGVALVDFYATWCGPCKMVAPIIEELAGEMQGQAKFVKVNTDECSKTAAKFQVTSIPTLVLMKDGKEVDRVVGVRDKDTLKSLVEEAL